MLAKGKVFGLMSKVWFFLLGAVVLWKTGSSLLEGSAGLSCLIGGTTWALGAGLLKRLAAEECRAEEVDKDAYSTFSYVLWLRGCLTQLAEEERVVLEGVLANAERVLKLGRGDRAETLSSLESQRQVREVLKYVVKPLVESFVELVASGGVGPKEKSVLVERLGEVAERLKRLEKAEQEIRREGFRVQAETAGGWLKLTSGQEG